MKKGRRLGNIVVNEGRIDVTYSDDLKEAAAQDQAVRDALKEFEAIVQEAVDGVNSGKYASFPDAMEALTGDRPIAMSDDDFLAETATRH